MSKYRIKNHGTNGYIVQEKNGWFSWWTFPEKININHPPIPGMKRRPRIFNTIEEARDFVKVQKEKSIQQEKDLKNAEHTEYL